jgi:hypothetical protein
VARPDAEAAETAPQGAPTAPAGTEEATPGPTNAAAPDTAQPGANKGATRKARQPRERDPRMPPVGTVLQKTDRHGNVRCECTVEADGIRYADKLYRSLSGAAMAAARDLGLKNKTFNGWVFWGVTEVARQAGDPIEALGRTWHRYHERATALAKTTDAEARARVAEAIQSHVAALTGLAAEVTA